MNKIQYFDLITQNTFDIYSHLKFVQTFKGALLGRCDTMLLQYKANTGCPSPGFRFVLRTRPGIIYNITMDGTLHIGGPEEENGAILFVESISPQYSIVPTEQAFKTGVQNKISLNFRAITNLTVVGILLVSECTSYCLEIIEMKVNKYTDALSEGNVDVGDSICQVNIPARRPACTVVDPPTVGQIVPKSQVKCIDDFAASLVHEEIENEIENILLPDITSYGINRRLGAIKRQNKPYKSKLDFDDVMDSTNTGSSPVTDGFSTTTTDTIKKGTWTESILQDALKKQNESVVEYDYLGEVVQKIEEVATTKANQGNIVLEFTTGKLWIYNGQKYVRFESSKAVCTFKDLKTGQIIEIEK